jgi:hypothetical protein
MFAGNIMHMPGQELREFTVHRPETRETEAGRAGIVNQYVEIGTIRAVLAQAKPEEVQRWRQLNHPVSHKIIMRGKPPLGIKPGYIFERAGQRFYVQALPNDIGDLGHWTIFFCNERSDA